MRTIAYELKGKEVPSELQGKVINIRVAESVADGIEKKIFASEQALLEKANDGVVIAVQGGLRNRAAKLLKDAKGDVGAAVAGLQKSADEYTYDVRQEGTGPSKPKTPAGIAKSKASSAGNRLFEKCAADETFLARMVKQGIVDQAEFDEWKTARDAATAAAGENHGEK